MLREITTHMPLKRVLLLAVSALVLLGAVAALVTTTNGRGLRAAGLMPEVVSPADRPRLTMDEIVVRAPLPDRLADASAHLSGIN
jgi:hypothetical protein